MARKQPPETPSAEGGFPDAHDILMNSPIGIYTTTLEGRFLSVNSFAARKLGYATPEELVDSIDDIGTQVYADPEDRKVILRRLANGGVVEGYECRLVRKDGTHMWISNTVMTVRDKESGKITHLQGFAIDITDRKRDEDKLRLQSLVLDQIEDRVTVTDLSGRITYVNQAVINSLGFTREEILNQSTEIYGEDPKHGATQREILKTTMRDGHWRGDVVNYTKD